MLQRLGGAPLAHAADVLRGPQPLLRIEGGGVRIAPSEPMPRYDL